MDKTKAALGSMPANAVGTCLTVNPATLSNEDRIHLLEEQMKHMQRMIIKLRKEGAGKTAIKSEPPDNANEDGLPIGTICYGATEKSPFLFYLTVEAEGYRVGLQLYASLSAAAEAVSQVRRSGWTFWKLLDGRSLKEAYRS